MGFASLRLIRALAKPVANYNKFMSRRGRSWVGWMNMDKRTFAYSVMTYNQTLQKSNKMTQYVIIHDAYFV
jgi:hypothetical protein